MEQFLILNSILLWIVLIINLLLTFGLIRRATKMTNVPDFENIPTLAINSQAPDFNAETLDGKLVSLNTYSNKSVSFIFVSPDCAPCIEKLPTFHKIGMYAKQHGVEIILVSLAEKKETLAFAEKHLITIPTLIAPQENNPFAKNYLVAGTPFYCLIDIGGKVKSTGLLGDKWDQLVQEWNTTL